MHICGRGRSVVSTVETPTTNLNGQNCVLDYIIDPVVPPTCLGAEGPRSVIVNPDPRE